MIQNYLKVALRYLLRNKGYTAINILGLAIGITCCILIMLFVRSEFSYDKFHGKSDRIYRAWVKEHYEDQDDIIDITTPLPLAGALQGSFGEIESTCRVQNLNSLVKTGGQSFNEDIRMVDSTFFKIFDFALLKGDRENPFPTSNSILLTENIAKKYFGKENAIGKNIELQLSNEKVLFSVSGIVRSAPEESSIKFNALIPFSNAKFLFSPRAMKAWFSISPETYVLLRENTDVAKLEKKFPSMVKQQLGEDYKEGGYIVSLQPITKIHLDTSLPAGIEPTSNPKYSYILLTIGILILLVACINFITLSVGRSATRAMEVGVRKVLGAERQQLVRQFWGEAILLTFISVIIGIGLTIILAQPFNQIVNRQLSVQFDFTFIGYCALIIVIIGLIAGIYPAIILSGFKPIEVLKGKLKLGNKTGFLRKSLITGQFVASIAMIVCTIVIGGQLDYLQNKDLGYRKEQVVIVPTNKPRLKGMELAELYRNELLKQPQVAGASVSLMSFSETPWVNIGYSDDKNIYRNFQFNAVDPYFLKTMGIQIAEGRDFSAENPADYTSSMIVNEAMVKMFGWKSGVGQKLPGRIEQQIIGVVKDFNYQSLHTKVEPLAMVIKPDTFFRRINDINFAAPPQPRISVRLKPGSLTANLNTLKQVWKNVAPDQEFEFRFLDETVAAQYRQEQRTATIVKIASALSIFIACMGLFGLATLTVVRRTREIGIRKVLGASVGSVVQLLSKEFIVLVIIAALIAFPLGWWAMNKWLEDFAYRIHIAWWVFPVAGIVALLIALLTVSFQAIKAALANPVKSLRTE
ncbi:MAG TPA: ABC transporter permease [Chitinophagaceae bacterium]|nr:ABC transporter permease [Chitinophagaceae bacterium]